MLHRTTALPPELRGRVYAHLGENDLNRLRALERHDPSARARRAEITRGMATRGLRRLLRGNPRGDRSSDDPADWTLDENPRVYVASLVAKLLPAVTVAVRILRGVPHDRAVPLLLRERLRVHGVAQGLMFNIVEDEQAKVRIDIEALNGTRSIMSSTITVDDVDISVLYDMSRPGHVSQFITSDTHGPRQYIYGVTPYHRCLDTATHKALRRARQIVDAELTERRRAERRRAERRR